MNGRSLGLMGLAAMVIAGCSPKDGAKEYEAGKAAYQLKDLVKADKEFSKCVQFASDNADAWLYLARVKLDLGELAEARKAVAEAERIAGDDWDVKLFSAQVAWHAKNYAAAVAIYRQLAENAAVEPAIRSQAYAGLGVVEMTCNNHHLARLAFFRAIRIDRKNASAWYHLGMLYRDAFGYLEAAQEQFEFFVRLAEVADVRVQKVQRNVIPALKETIAQAAASRPGVSKRDSGAASTAIGKAEAALKKNALKVAKAEYEKALKADPLSYQAALGLAKTLAKIDGSKKGQEAAYAAYKNACTLRPSAVATFLTTGALASKLGYHSQAVEIYSRAVAASPTSISALDGLIGAMHRAGNKNAVAKAYQQYRDMLPKRK